MFEKVQVPLDAPSSSGGIISLQPAAGGLLLDGPSTTGKVRQDVAA